MSGKLTGMRLGEGLDQGLTDWAGLEALTDDEIAEVIRNDPDAFELDPAWLEDAQFVRVSRPKRRLTVRLDSYLVDWFKAERAQIDALRGRSPFAGLRLVIFRYALCRQNVV